MDRRSKPTPSAWAPHIDHWCSMMRASGLSPETVYLRRAHLAHLARGVTVAPEEVTLEEILGWLGVQDWQRETRRSHRSSYRRFFAFMGRHDLTEGLPRVKPSEPMPSPIPEGALLDGLAAADDRTRLMLRLAAEAGMRRGEIAQVRAIDVTRAIGGHDLLVHGKGGKLRMVPISDSLAALIRLRAGGGWLFPGEHHRTGHISPAWVGKLTSRVLPDPWTLHKLRHRFATVIHEETRDLLIVQALLGHASLATTQRYVPANRDRMRAAIAAVAA